MEASRGEAWERGFLGLHRAGKVLPRVVPKESQGAYVSIGH